MIKWALIVTGVYGIILSISIYMLTRKKKDNINDIIEWRKKQFKVIQGGKSIEKKENRDN